jgi:hypothetical protein
MPQTSDALRLMWLPELTDVSSPSLLGFDDWLVKYNYQVYSPISPSQFSASYTDCAPLANALACELDQAAIAAIESMQSVTRIRDLPKSFAWAAVEAYYASFYAAHALLRMAGRCFRFIDTPALTRLGLIASAYAMLPGKSPTRGYYTAIIDRNTNSVVGTRRQGIPWTSHVTLWYEFDRLLDDTLSEIGRLNASIDPSVTLKLMQLKTNLRSDNSLKAQWMSIMRNAITYQFAYKSWFPDHCTEDAAVIYKDYRSWSKDALSIDLTSQPDERLKRFINTAAFMVGMLLDACWDLERRCTQRRSFLSMGAVRLSRQLRLA